ncbi:YitT family protein [Rhizobium sp. C4]|uniref:YitT family protein n=1 Tax=Rhizobium sp. C4 TaxID=1349800 RepID=UPI001E61E45C|nr:YitT family protein [Rhizobium sp. C4]MCD2174590.1 YitT family protein [Rhizobium sp. C4]
MNTAAPGKTFSDYLKSTSDKHSLLEDAQGVASGAMLASLGVLLLSSAGLLTGGTAGVAFLLHYATGYSFGVVFFVVNLPFYYLAWTRLGWAFTLKTFATVAATSTLSIVLPKLIPIGQIDPLAGALFGGLLVGTAMLALFRHRASLGGFGVLALYLQEKLGWKAGLVQLGFDCCVLFFAFFIATPYIIICSIIGAVVLNMVLAINHRRDRYIAM